MDDLSILGAIARLSEMAIAVEVEQRRALERAALVVEAEAKREIGTYQDETGPFAPWAELADTTKNDRVRQGFSENEPLLRTGDMRDSIDHVVEQDEAVVGSNSDIAVYQELGTDRIPPRSFLGGAASRRGEEVARILGGGVVKALVGKDVVGGLLPIP
jgi:phage gpG-like protein